MQLEAFSFQRHRIDAYVQQDLGAVGGTQGDCMFLRRNGDNRSITRRMQGLACRIDREAIAQHAR